MAVFTALADASRQAVLVTALVGVMMLLVEYLHTATKGYWQTGLVRGRLTQYVLGAALGASPGCLGAFGVVALYTHGRLSLGAVVASMISTAGDESFVMLAMFPRQAVAIHLFLFLLGVAGGYVADALFAHRRFGAADACASMVVHAEGDGEPDRTGRSSSRRTWLPLRVGLTTAWAALLLGIVTGIVGPATWCLERAVLVATAGVAVLLTAAASDHFVREHLWVHIIRQHMPRIFLWTLGALIVVGMVGETDWVEQVLREGRWVVLVVACAMGIIPESGPHLLFVSLYASGMLPVSVLLANSVVQDGHGALPLLAHSRSAFLRVKAISMGLGFVVGAVLMVLGY